VNRAPRFYHSGETEDVGFVVGLLRERFPTRPLMAIGFSLGGNILLKFLGEQGVKNAAPVSAAVAISVPYDLSAGAASLERGGMVRIYSGYFLRSLLAKAHAKEEILANVLDLDAVRASTTIRDFDEATTARLHGFADAEDYYRNSSSNQFLQSVRIPTLLLHSRDDPFLSLEALPLSAIEANPFLTLVLTDRGGHVGFFEEGHLGIRPFGWRSKGRRSWLTIISTPQQRPTTRIPSHPDGLTRTPRVFSVAPSEGIQSGAGRT